MSDILVDTSVWLDFFKRRDSIYSEALDALLVADRGRVQDVRSIVKELEARSHAASRR